MIVLLAILLGGGTWVGTAWAWGCIQAFALLVVASHDAWVTGFRWVVYGWWLLAVVAVACTVAGLSGCAPSATLTCPTGFQPLFNGMEVCGTVEQACDFECDILRDYCVAGCAPGAPDCDPIQWERAAVQGVPLQTRGACEAEWSGCRARCLP